MADFLQAAKLLELIEAAEAQVPATEPYSDAELDPVLLAGGPRPGSQESKLRATLVNDLIRSCPRCKVVLDLPAPIAGLPTETWRCKACHSVFITGPTDGVAEAANKVAQRAFQDSRIAIDRLPVCETGALKGLVRTLTAAAYNGPERRAYPRYSASLPAIGVPLNEHFDACARPFRVTTRDVSGSGLSGFTETPPPTDLALIDFTPAGLFGWQVAVQINRRRSSGFLKEFGGRFVTSDTDVG